MMIFDSLEILPPNVEIGMLKRNSIYAVGDHQRMRFCLGTIDVKFFFEQVVDRYVERERKLTKRFYAEPSVQIKTARAFEKIFQLGAAKFEWLVRGGIKNISGALAVGHGEYVMAILKLSHGDLVSAASAVFK